MQTDIKKQKSDTAKALLLIELSFEYQSYKPDSALLLAQQAYNLSLRHQFLKGESWALNQMGNAFRELGNNVQALAYFLRQLKIEEERNFPANLARINMNIAFVFNRENDTSNAIQYILKADSIIKTNNITELEPYGYFNTGDIFEKANRLPEAIAYNRQSYELAVKNKDSVMIGSALNNFGNMYAKTGDWQKAIINYRQGIPYLMAAHDNKSISETYMGLAKLFDHTGQPDSALHYATAAYTIAAENGFAQNKMASSALLTNLYKKLALVDSAFAYQQIMVDLKDSIESSEKIKQVVSMSIAEQLRQQQLADTARQEKEELRQKLQLLAIGTFIPLFFLMSMYISRKQVSKKVIQFFGILSMLLVFEYITLFIHPFVVNITHHSPLLEIIILVCIAALVVPAHHKIEKWFTRRLSSINEKHIQRKIVQITAPVPEEEPVVDEPEYTVPAPVIETQNTGEALIEAETAKEADLPVMTDQPDPVTIETNSGVSK